MWTIPCQEVSYSFVGLVQNGQGIAIGDMHDLNLEVDGECRIGKSEQDHATDGRFRCSHFSWTQATA